MMEETAVLDFTSVLYLGFLHSSRELRPWQQFTTGVPAALAEPKISNAVANKLARLQGCEQSTLSPSTLHLFWDLFALITEQPTAIYLDAGAYPIARWGVERAALRDALIHYFPHRDGATLAQMIGRESSRRRPIIVSDGICTGCGCTVPVASYLKIARQRDGLVILDDTQALGLLGSNPDNSAPYGHGGGGSLRHSLLGGPEVILVSSLAKSFGVPVAVLSGSKAFVQHFQANSKSRVHCSPPSIVTLHAAERALYLNKTEGDIRRHRLAANVQSFRHMLAEVGLMADGGLFPVQTIRLLPYIDVAQLHQTLLDRGVRSVLRRGCNGRLAISFVITARHRLNSIKYAVEKLTASINTNRDQRRLQQQRYFFANKGGNP